VTYTTHDDWILGSTHAEAESSNAAMANSSKHEPPQKKVGSTFSAQQLWYKLFNGSFFRKEKKSIMDQR